MAPLTSTSCMLFLTAIILSVLPALSQAVKCYECSSLQISRCAEPFNKSEINICTGNYCSKVVYVDKGVTSIFRMCVAEAISNNCKKTRTDDVNTYDEECTCGTDYCNGVSGFNYLTPSIFLLLCCIAVLLEL